MLVQKKKNISLTLLDCFCFKNNKVLQENYMIKMSSGSLIWEVLFKSLPLTQFNMKYFQNSKDNKVKIYTADEVYLKLIWISPLGQRIKNWTDWETYLQACWSIIDWIWALGLIQNTAMNYIDVVGQHHQFLPADTIVLLQRGNYSYWIREDIFALYSIVCMHYLSHERTMQALWISHISFGRMEI